ncbi:flippase [Candidatus Woesearchaeota archaeon]|nr:flippase [Candidatus Woesearchaeota archaeon]
MESYTKFAVRGATTILLISIIAAILGYVVRVLLARNLSVEEFGLFYAVFAFVGIFGIFKSLGFDRALAKFIPEFVHKKKSSMIKNCIMYSAFIQLLTNSVVIIVLYILSDFLAANYFKYDEAGILLKVLAVAFFIDSFVQTLKFAFQGFKKPVYFSGIDVIRGLLLISIIIIGLKLNYGVLSPAYAYVIASAIITVLFSVILVKKVFPDFLKSKFSFNKKLIKRLFKYGIHVISISVGVVILGSTDIVMLTYFTDLKAVALYSVALPTARALRNFILPIAAVLLPLTSELWAKNNKKILIAGMESLYKYSIIMIIPLALVMLSFTDLLIQILYGKDYLSASTSMKILAVGMIFAVLSVINSNFFAGIGKPQIYSKIIYFGAALNFVLNLILIPVIGIIGAAISTASSYFIIMALTFKDVRKYIKLSFPIGIWARTVLAGAIFTLLIWALKRVLSLNIWAETAIILVISGIIYAAMLFLFRIIDIREVKDLYRRIVK